MECFLWAGADTVAAADALHTVRLFARIDIHFAGICAGAAVDTFFFAKVHADQGEAVKETVEGA